MGYQIRDHPICAREGEVISVKAAELLAGKSPCLLTIITPVYNDAAHIRETVISVRDAMKNVSFEHIIVDDGSTDGTFDQIADLLGDKIICIRQPNAGQSGAVNLGLARARGKYGIVVNSDDPLFTEELALRSIETLEGNSSIVATYPDWRIINARGEVIRTKKVREFSLDEMLGNFNCLIGPGGIFRVIEANKVGGWSTRFRYVPDFDFWLRLSDLGMFKRIPKVLAQWRTHSKSISIGSRGLQMSLERIEVIEQYLDSHIVDSALRQRARASALYSAATLSIFDARVKGVRLLLRALQSDWSILFRRNPLRTMGIAMHFVARPTHKLISRLQIKSQRH
jgi:glycosyltransferase involved in cell wall biosynthesis